MSRLERRCMIPLMPGVKGIDWIPLMSRLKRRCMIPLMPGVKGIDWIDWMDWIPP